ncbi:MAG: hypothetical protein IJO32_07450 [Bacilli bacterium]|nr:hypothetical protein [Bacilli bacterium]
MSWFTELLMTGIRYLLLFIDSIVYSLVDFFYNLFFVVSRIRLLSGGALIEEIAGRIYALIGVYALFKVTFILINMIVNPDSINDKQKGAGKIVVRLVGMLALIIAIPWCFTYAYKIQDAILKDNIISAVILGTTTENDKETGATIANTIFSGFATIDEGALTDPDADDPLDVSNLSDDACEDSLHAINNIGNDGVSSLYAEIDDVYEGENGDTFCIDYKIFLSLIAGGFAAYMFAVYCLDIGLRVAKMAFYELTAPIPIVSFLDGKKDGPFNNWLKSVLSTYADVFLRLIIINFVIFFIQYGLPELDTFFSELDYGFATENFAKIIVILGLLMFAAQAPKLIKDLFGIKGEGGDYGLSVGKKLAAAPLAAGAVGAMAAGGSVVAAKVGKEASNIKAGWKSAGPDGGMGAKLRAAASASTAGKAGQAITAFADKNANVMVNPMLSGREKASQVMTNFWNAGKSGLMASATGMTGFGKNLISGAKATTVAAQSSGGKKSINAINIARNAVDDKALKSTKVADAWKNYVYGAGGTQERAAETANIAARTQSQYQALLNQYTTANGKQYMSNEYDLDVINEAIDNGTATDEQKLWKSVYDMEKTYTEQQEAASKARAEHEKAVTDMGKAKEYDAEQRAKAGIVKKADKMDAPPGNN